MNKKYWLDMAERTGWTAGYAGLSYLITQASGWSYSWAPILIVGLTMLKTTVAHYVGNPDTAKFDSKEISA